MIAQLSHFVQQFVVISSPENQIYHYIWIMLENHFRSIVPETGTKGRTSNYIP